MVRPNSNLRSLKTTKPEIFKGNFMNAVEVEKALKGCQLVVHVAANTLQQPSDYKNYKTVNVEGTQFLLEKCSEAGIEKFIYVGSANAFGPGSKENPGDETSPFTKLQRQSGYMRSKFEAQKIVLDFHKKHQFPVTVVNPTFMLGKYDAKPSSGQMLLMAHGKKWMPAPAGGKNFVHVEDVATGILNALEQGQNGACYLLGNENLSYHEFFTKMRHICGYPKQVIPISKPAISIVGKAGSFYEKITGRPAKLNSINAQLLSLDNYYLPLKAVTELQLPQTPIKKAIADTLAWFDENGYLN